LAEVLKRGVDFLIGGSLYDLNWYAEGSGRRHHVSRRQLVKDRIGRIHKEAKCAGCRNQLVQQREPFCSQLSVELVETGEIATWSIETCNKTELHRVSADTEHNGTVVVAAFAASVEGRPGVTITATGIRISSATNAGSRSGWLPPQRYSTARFRPST
jgi:hypothetical protein